MNYFYPLRVLFPTLVRAQLVLSQETGNLGERPPSVPRPPVEGRRALGPRRQETLHSSQHNGYSLGPAEYRPLCVYMSLYGNTSANISTGISVCV